MWTDWLTCLITADVTCGRGGDEGRSLLAGNGGNGGDGGNRAELHSLRHSTGRH